jgi:hypothetical protein
MLADGKVRMKRNANSTVQEVCDSVVIFRARSREEVAQDDSEREVVLSLEYREFGEDICKTAVNATEDYPMISSVLNHSKG